MTQVAGLQQRDSITRKSTLVLLLWLLALGLVAWTLRQLPLSEIVSQLALLALPDWLFWFLINAVILYLAVKRWQLLGQALQASLPLASLFRLRQAGSIVSFLTPGPHFGGEPLQLYWLHRHYGTAMHRAVATLGLDRFVETGTNLAVLLAGLLMLLATTLLPVQEWLLVTAILVGVLCVMLLAAALVLRHPDWLARRCSPLVERLRTAVAGMRGDGIVGSSDESVRQKGRGGWQALVTLLRDALSGQRPKLWLALLLSLAGWGALLIELAMLLGFLGLAVSPTDIVLVMLGMRLAMLLPVPGGIGTIEASLLWSFQYLGYPAGAALGLIALIRLRDALVLLIGAGCLFSFYRAGHYSEPAVLAE